MEKVIIALYLGLMALAANASSLIFYTHVNPPYVIQEQQQLSGLNIDIFQLLKQKSGLDLQLRVLSPKRAYKLTLYSPNSCVFTIERTESRESLFTWISPLFANRFALYQRHKNAKNLRSLADFNGIKIGSYLGSSVSEYLSSFNLKLDLTTTNLNSAEKLHRERIDAWASDTLLTAYILENNNLDINPQGFEFYSSLEAIACNKQSNPAILQRLQEHLNQLQRSGEINKLIQHYQRLYGINTD
ncbi:substrate-binding periplasmic protein [Agarivorans sp. QJM3NY_29]|uniref:substrate-binding periplasmic protein n=1 Tax=unclassified Agarivorans TaxID=2636026 RepID=UPI003D7C942C